MRAVLRAGALYTYLTKLPLLGDVSEVSIAYLSSLQVCPSTAMLMLGRALSLSFTSSLFHSLLHSFTHCFTYLCAGAHGCLGRGRDAEAEAACRAVERRCGRILRSMRDEQLGVVLCHRQRYAHLMAAKGDP